MAAFVDGEMVEDPVDLGPLVGVERGFMTKEKVPWSGGMSGVEMVTTPTTDSPVHELPVLTLSPATASPSPKKRGVWKGKAKAVDCDRYESDSSEHGPSRPVHSPRRALPFLFPPNFLLTPGRISEWKAPG